MDTTKTKAAKKATKKATKKTVKVTERPESGTGAPVDPFATKPSTGNKKVSGGDNINNAPSNDEELGNVAASIADFAQAKADHKAAEARFKAVSGTVMAYSKRILLSLMAKSGSKPASQKLVGDGGATVTTYYQDKPLKMDGDNTGRYDTLRDMFGEEIVDTQIAEFTKWSIPDEKMADEALVKKMKEALQAALTPEELDGLFVAEHKARKGVLDIAAKLCDTDTERMDMLLQLVVPKPTLR